VADRHPYGVRVFGRSPTVCRWMTRLSATPPLSRPGFNMPPSPGLPVERGDLGWRKSMSGRAGRQARSVLVLCFPRGLGTQRAAVASLDRGAHYDFCRRQAILTILHNLLRQVENVTGKLVGIVGEPGIGISSPRGHPSQRGPGRGTWLEGVSSSYGTSIRTCPSSICLREQLRHSRE